MRNPQSNRKRRAVKKRREERERRKLSNFVWDLNHAQIMTLSEFAEAAHRYGYTPTFDLIKKYYPVPQVRKIRND